MRIFFLFICILTITVAIDLPARAQTAGTGFVLVPQGFSVDDVEMASVDFDEAFQMFDNPFLSDIVKLNYQISLLEKMVERQAELQKISESFESMGARFEVPPPPRGICAQLPANAACLKFYPELYSDLVASRKAYYEELRAIEAAKDPNNKVFAGESKEEAEARRAREEAELRAKLAKAERKSRYKWTDITCTGPSCRGVLIGTQRKGYRATVREGERLNDGTLVQSVSADGITVVIDGDVIHVRPAPGENGSASGGTDPAAAFIQAFGGSSGDGSTGTAFAGDSGTGSSAGSSGGGDAEGGTATGDASAGTSAANAAAAEEAAKSADAALGSATAAGQTMAEPTLGPSGLF